MEVFRKTTNRHIDWLDIDKEICNESSVITRTWFGIFDQTNKFDVTHTLPDKKDKKIGFIESK